jgi:hypothetical protein
MDVDWTVFGSDPTWAQALIAALVMLGSLIAAPIAFWFSWESRRLSKEALARADRALSLDESNKRIALYKEIYEEIDLFLEKIDPERETYKSKSADDLMMLIHQVPKYKSILLEIYPKIYEATREILEKYGKIFEDHIDMEVAASEYVRYIELRNVVSSKADEFTRRSALYEIQALNIGSLDRLQRCSWTIKGKRSEAILQIAMN